MVVLLILVALIIAWIVYLKSSVAEKKEKTLESFNSLDKLLQKRYKSVQFLIDFVKNSAENLKPDAEYLEKLMSEAISLGTDEKNIDRRIAYDIELAKCTEKVLSVINENYADGNDELKKVIDEYEELNIPIKIAEEKYNIDAEILRLAVDKFPSSFVARLIKVKYFDTI